MKFSTAAAASVCLVGNVSAFVFPAAVRTGTQIEAGKSMDADMIRAREKLVASPQMTELLNLVDTIETVDPVEAPATEEAAPPAPDADEPAAEE